MGYFGGYGAGKGWHKFQFLICPDALRNVLTKHELRLVITNRAVPSEYRFTPIDEYIASYAEYLDEAMAYSAESRQAAGDVYTGIVASLDIFGERTCQDPAFKRMEPSEPIVDISSLMLHYDGNRLSTNVYSDIYFGLEMTFPKVVSFSSDGHEKLYETNEYSTFAVYQFIKAEIKSLTAPCKIRSPSRDHRTSVRISPPMKSRLCKHSGIGSIDLELI